MTLVAQPLDPIFAGTQVVSLAEVRGTNDSLVHPRGAVGVVTRTPAGAVEKHFLVRFPDGFEASLTRDQLEILKHFKDRLGASGIGAAQSRRDGGASFELESFIIYRCVIGSRAFGLDHDESDTDRRGVYLAPAALHWSLFGAPEQFEDNASQSCYWELQKFLTMALKANPNILECLYSPIVEKATPLGAELLALREAFLSQMIFQTFNGYAMSQFKKIEQDMRNHGSVRWKHAMHLLRLLLSGAAALREARVPVRVEAYRERLHAELKTIACGCVTRHHSHHYFGFAETQWKLFDKARPRRVKPLLYVYRVLLTGIHLMRAGEVEANLVTLNEEFRLPYLADLVARKLAGPEKSTLEDADVVLHEKEYQRLRGELQAAHDASRLPELPAEETRAALNHLLVRVRMKAAR